MAVQTAGQCTGLYMTEKLTGARSELAVIAVQHIAIELNDFGPFALQLGDELPDHTFPALLMSHARHLKLFRRLKVLVARHCFDETALYLGQLHKEH